MRLAPEARDPNLLKLWNKAGTELVDMIAEAATRFSGDIRLVDPVIEPMIAVPEPSYAPRDANSAVRRVLATGAREAPYPDQMHPDLARHPGPPPATSDGKAKPDP